MLSSALILQVCEGGGNDGEGFFQIRREMPGAEKSGLELGGREIDSAVQAGVEKPGKGAGVAAFGVGEVRDRTGREEEAEHRADAVKGEWFIPEERAQAFFHKGTGFFEKFPTARGFQGLELCQSRRKREGIPAERARLIDRACGSELVHDFSTSPEGSDREPSADDFAHRGEIGADAKNLLRSAGSQAEARHHLVKNEDGSVFGAEFAEKLQESRMGKIEAGIRGDGFQNNSGEFGSVVCEKGAQGLRVIEREGRSEGREGCGNARTIRLAEGQRAAACLDQKRINMAVVTALEFENAVASGEAASKTQAAHGRFGAAVDHSHFFKRRDESAESLRHFDFEWVWSSEAESAKSCLADGLDNGRGGMSQNGRPPSAHVINQFASVCCEKSAAFSALHKKRFAADSPKGADRRIHSARDSATGGGKQIRRRRYLMEIRCLGHIGMEKEDAPRGGGKSPETRSASV